MWSISKKQLSARTVHFRFQQLNQSFLSFRDTIDLWSSNSQEGNFFRLFTSLTIASSTFQAFRWETPAVTTNSLDRDFEFVLIDSPGLDRRENGESFRAQFEKTQIQTDSGLTSTTITFANLGQNAILIAPIPSQISGVNHCHLGSYLRTADQTSGLELWQAIGVAMKDRINHKPVWLNTAGGSVAWLHVRLDDRPKYYHHSDFKALPNET